FYRNCGGLFLVVEGEERIWGYMVTCIRGDAAELVSVAVDRRARRTGAASTLMASVLRRLRLRKGIRFVLMVRTSNRRARKFYEKYGFAKQRIVRGYYERGADGVRMVKWLNGHHSKGE